MKIVFRLEGEEIARAQELKNLIEKIKECYSDSNEILGIRTGTQKTRVSIAYEGRRKSFLEGGGFALVMKIFGSILKASQRITYYETSDKRLEWFETFPIFLKRANWWEIKNEIKNYLYHVAELGNSFYVDENDLIFEKIPKDLGNVMLTCARSDKSIEEKIKAIDDAFNLFCLSEADKFLDLNQNNRQEMFVTLKNDTFYGWKVS